LLNKLKAYPTIAMIHTVERRDQMCVNYNLNEEQHTKDHDVDAALEVKLIYEWTNFFKN
jgi:hypothetical protein